MVSGLEAVVDAHVVAVGLHSGGVEGAFWAVDVLEGEGEGLGGEEVYVLSEFVCEGYGGFFEGADRGSFFEGEGSNGGLIFGEAIEAEESASMPGGEFAFGDVVEDLCGEA